MKHTTKFEILKWIKKILFVLFCLSILFLFFYFFKDISNYFFKGENAPQGELIKVILTFIAGIIALLVWHSGYKRVKVMEKQTEKTAEQIRVMYKGNVDTRFNSAVGHLGNSNPAVVLGGIHVLHQIAVEHKSYTQIVHNLFCSFLRENSANLYNTTNKCPVIIQTLITYLFCPYNKEENVYKAYPSDLSFSVLKNCDFPKIEMSFVNFNNCTLEDWNFWGGTFTKCNFEGATLINCNFFDRTFTECDFGNTTLTNCRFENGTLIKCSFSNVILTECDFMNGTLTKCNFGGKLLKCDFTNAPFTKCYLGGELTNCKFSCGTFIEGGLRGTLTECNFDSRRFTECDFSNGTLIKCIFNNVILTKCKFREATLTECEFKGAAYLIDGSLIECDFWYGKLTKCNFEGGKFSKCNLWGGILTKCNFRESGFTECDFLYGTLKECDFSRATLTKCDFIDKQYNGKNKASLIDCNFGNTTLIDTELQPSLGIASRYV